MEPFEILLESSAAAHGHLRPGQVVGVRMAILDCRLIGLEEPKQRDQIKKHLKMNRCTADAVAHVTGVKLGRRSLNTTASWPRPSSILKQTGPFASFITEIRPGEFKGAAFTKGHTICNEDICHLQKLGKNHLYLINLEEDEIHENKAAAILAKGLAGPCISWRINQREENLPHGSNRRAPGGGQGRSGRL
jgi:hypothetical protein